MNDLVLEIYETKIVNNLEVIEQNTVVELIISDVLYQGGGSGENSISKVSGENIPSHTPIAIVDNTAYRLDASNTNHAFAFVGFSKTSAMIGENCTIQQIGEITLNNWGLIPNTQYLASNNGMITTNNTNPNHFTRVIGYATASNSLQIIKDSITIKK